MKYSLTLLLFLMTKLVISQSMGLALEGEEWMGVQEYRVKGRSGILINKKLSFGEYKTLDVDRSWTTGTKSVHGLLLYEPKGNVNHGKNTSGFQSDGFYDKIITTDVIDKKQTLYFSLSDSAGNVSKAFCASRVHVEDFNIGNYPMSNVNLLLDIFGKGKRISSFFFTKIYIETLSDSWVLIIDNHAALFDPQGYVGCIAKNKEEYFLILPTTRVKNKKGKTSDIPVSAGFEFRDQSGKPLAAVWTMGKGIVYLKEMDAKQKLLIATACAALLLQEDI
jgi:hypothetical protein